MEQFVFLRLRGCLPQHHTDQTSAQCHLFPRAKSVAVRLPRAPLGAAEHPPVAQALAPSPAAPRGRPACPCHLPPHAVPGKRYGSVIKPASLSRSGVVERQRRALQPGAPLVRRPERDACRASPVRRTGLGRCFNGRVRRDAWAAPGAVLSPRHSAGDTEPAFHQGHDREVLALALRTAFLRRSCTEPFFGKELVLACWAGARPGNYNLLAQTPPAVSEVRSSQLAPSALVLLLCSRDCIWVLNEAIQLPAGAKRAASCARRRWRLLAPGLVLWCWVGSAESRRSWEGRSGLRQGLVATWASASPRGGPHGVRLKATPSGFPLALRGCSLECGGGRGWWWLFRRGEGAQPCEVGFGAELPAPSSPLHPSPPSLSCVPLAQRPGESSRQKERNAVLIWGHGQGGVPIDSKASGNGAPRR